MTKSDGNGHSARDPLTALRGDPSLDAVWQSIVRGESTEGTRAALIAHYRAERQRHFTKKAIKDAPDDG